MPYSVQYWGQYSPFNSSIPNNANGYPIGCSAVAIGQVMAYHQFPLYWNWTGIISLQDTVIGPYMYAIATGINTTFGTESGATINSMKNYLSDSNIGYNVQKVSHNTNSVISSLASNRPVIMTGTRTTSTGQKGHAWVCDGYTVYISSYKFTLLILSLTEPLSYEPCGTPYTYTSNPYRTFHMVWGWDGSNNGSYSEASWPTNRQYVNNRENLINIYPNQ